MSALILPRRLTSQPQGVAQLDRKNTLTRGLVAAYLPNNPLNIVTGIHGKFVGTKSRLVNAGHVRGYGAAVGIGSTDRFNSGYTKASTEATVFFQAVMNGSGGGALGRVFQKGAGGTGSEYIAYSVGDQMTYSRRTSGGVNAALATFPIAAPLGTPFSCTLVTDGIVTANLRIYVDGNLTSPTGFNGVAGDIANDTDEYIIGNRADNSRNWDGTLGLMLFYNRQLSEAEAKSLSENPWQIFQPTARILPFSAVVGGGSSLDIAATLGTAAAAGFLASVDRQLAVAATISIASAAGFTASIDRQTTITGTLGVATATGLAANIDQQTGIAAGIGQATADGFTASVQIGADLHVVATIGTAAANGLTANVDQQLSIVCAMGTATADGFTVAIDFAVGAIARPSADSSAGTWTPSAGGDLYAMLDEETPDDADYIIATAATSCELALSSVADPATSTGQVVSYRAWSPTGNGLTVSLKQGTTIIASWTHASLPATATTYQQALTAGECDAITDYAGLSIEMTSI